MIDFRIRVVELEASKDSEKHRQERGDANEPRASESFHEFTEARM